MAVAMVVALTLSGCATAVGAAMAAQEIRQGLVGIQQLVTGSRSTEAAEIELPTTLVAPVAGTYRGYQVLGADTVRFYLRTAQNPTAPIVDAEGEITGYALAGLVATSLDSLESRVQAWTRGRPGEEGGSALFFVEGTQQPDPNARSLFPAAFLGRLASGESPEADEQHEALLEMEVDLSAPGVNDLTGRGIVQQLFSSVAEGIFTLHPGGNAVYRQESEMEGGDSLILHFERISTTTLPG